MTHTATPAAPLLLPHFDLLATAPGGVARLRELILTLAVQGKLVPQDPNDEPASVLLQRIRAEKDRLIAAGKIKRDKPLPPIADEEKSFELPQGWEWVRLGDLVDLVYGRNLSTTKLIEDGFPVFGANGVIGCYNEYLYEYEQLLISCRGAYSGKPNISPKKCFVTNNSIICRFIDRGQVDINFIYRQLQVVDKSRMVTGSAQPQVTIANAEPLVLAFPPLAEQSRIVARVEELMRLCDALEAQQTLHTAQHTQLVQTLLGTLTDSATPAELADQWQRVAAHFDTLFDRPEAVDALEQTILQLAVRGLLVPQDPKDEPASALLQRIRAEKDRLIAAGKIKRDKPLPPIADEENPFELPQGWEWVRLGNVGFWAIGSGFPHEIQGAEGLPILFAKVSDMNLPGNELSINRTNNTIDNDTAEKLRINVHQAGTVIFPKIGGAIATNKRRIIVQPTAIDNNCLGIAPSIAIETSYLFLLLLSLDFTKYQAGTSVPALSQGTLSLIPVGLPPLAEQSRIVARVEELRQLCANLRQRLAAGRTTQRHLAEALLESAGAA